MWSERNSSHRRSRLGRWGCSRRRVYAASRGSRERTPLHTILCWARRRPECAKNFIAVQSTAVISWSTATSASSTTINATASHTIRPPSVLAEVRMHQLIKSSIAIKISLGTLSQTYQRWRATTAVPTHPSCTWPKSTSTSRMFGKSMQHWPMRSRGKSVLITRSSKYGRQNSTSGCSNQKKMSVMCALEQSSIHHHIRERDLSRQSYNIDVEKAWCQTEVAGQMYTAINDRIMVIETDLQKQILTPISNASSFYFMSKLTNYN